MLCPSGTLKKKSRDTIDHIKRHEEELKALKSCYARRTAGTHHLNIGLPNRNEEPARGQGGKAAMRSSRPRIVAGKTRKKRGVQKGVVLGGKNLGEI